METPKISVIIPTYHRNDLLARCLACLAPGVQTLPTAEYEVIVTDDSSKTTAEQMIREHYPWAKWVAGPQNGPAANRNCGAWHSQGEWLAFTDDDCLPERSWLAAFAEVMKGESLALEGAIHPIGNANQDMAECPVNLAGGNFWSANIAVKRSLFNQIHGFDSTYPLAAHEDQDLKIRLAIHTNIQFVPDAIINHPVRLIPLKEALQRIPKRSVAWAHHVNKHSQTIGYENLWSSASTMYMFHVRCLFRNLCSWHIKNAIVSLLMLIIGNPLVLIFRWHYKATEGKTYESRSA